ncbi:methyl-accepting chemotaxis protein [Piscinibacter defluvii]|uniref:methyl-accepting chemotaxis protein n=1 Tax=Piscinibacter defluvii TaxID=1796922 RepID=UPI000FDF6436|nr:methyl-accepting chemotaxis protein [Piscinibacter defluvii]
MNPLTSFGISGRLYAVAGVLSLALAGVAGMSYTKLSDVEELAHHTEEQRVPQLQRVAQLELNVTRTSLQLRHAILSRTPQELEATLADVGEKRKLIAELMASFEKALETPEGKSRFAKLPPLFDKFWAVGTENIQLIKAGQKVEAFAFLVDKTIPARNDVLVVLADLVKLQEGLLREDLNRVESQAATTLKVLIGLVLATMGGLMVFSWHISSVLRRRVATSREVAERVRDGDLATAIRDDAKDEFSPLLAALRDMQEALTRVVSNVRGNAESVATASAQIAQGNQDLSGRTEQQASALQQTAATMDELGSTVRNNADNAKQANQLAAGASSVAQRGGEVVSQVVDTMKGINDSSRKIADIIGVIDGIAFQTNILALNAAVEAARAGEQGRGFAVVAGEVRNLAQRSAEAAKEIKSLISDSVERVERGSQPVDEAGTTMAEIVHSIQRVTDIMGEISSASVEQSSGVAQVGQAVNQMDQATQQNAALVEQSAAAAEGLKGQARQLVDAVAVFRLSHDAGYRTAAPAPTPAATVRAAVPAKKPAAKPLAAPVAKPAAKASEKPAVKPAAPTDAALAAAGTDSWETF